MAELNLFNRVLQGLKVRRQRILDGLINCVPLPYPRLRQWLPGFEKRRYNVITANQKVGKSKFVDYTIVYETFFYWIEHPEQLSIQVLYFPLEVGKEEKIHEFLSHLLFRLDKVRISPSDLRSTSADKPIPEEILSLLESERYRKYIDKFTEVITYIDTERSPTAIYNYIWDFMSKRGTMHYKTIKIKNAGGLEEEKSVIDYFEPFNENEVVFVILDNYSNLNKERGMNKMETIESMSKKFITLRDIFELNVTAIQHQAQAQEGIENLKLNKLMPSSDGLADCKTTTRDVNLVLGLYSPFKYGLKDHEGYDLTKFRNNIRFLYVVEDRDYGSAGMICPLFFDGAVSTFSELPKANDTEGIAKCLNYIDTVVRHRVNLGFMGLKIREARVRKTRIYLHKLMRILSFAS